MALGKVLARGQVTLPRSVRQKERIKPGDVLNIEALGPGRVECTVLPNRSPRELRDRYPIEGPSDEASDREAWEAKAAKDIIGGRDG